MSGFCFTCFIRKTSTTKKRGGLFDSAWIDRLELGHDLLQWRVEALHGGFAQVSGDAVVGFGDAAGNSGDGIAVAANRDGVADGVFKARRGEEGDERLRHGALAGRAELIGRPDLVEREVQRVVAVLRELIPVTYTNITKPTIRLV